MTPFKDETGNRYGRLTVIERIHMKSIPKKSRAIFRCQCVCGNYINLPGWLLRNGVFTECGPCTKKWGGW